MYSPIFLTQVKGYCFILEVDWSGKKKKNLGLYLRVCCGNNYKPLKPFRMLYSLEMVGKQGNILTKKVPLSEIEAYSEDCFTLPPGENKCKFGWGFAKFLSMPELNCFK